MIRLGSDCECQQGIGPQSHCVEYYITLDVRFLAEYTSCTSNFGRRRVVGLRLRRFLRNGRREVFGIIFRATEPSCSRSASQPTSLSHFSNSSTPQLSSYICTLPSLILSSAMLEIFENGAEREARYAITASQPFPVKLIQNRRYKRRPQ